MPATTKGPFTLQEVRDQTLESAWSYTAPGDTTPVSSAGSLFGWGNNFSGYGAGLPPINNGISSPVQVPGTTWARLSGQNDSFAAVKCDNTMWYWGLTTHGSQMINTGGTQNTSSPIQMPGTGWCNLTRTQGNHYGIKANGTLWSAGYGYYGLNGDNTNISRSSMVQIPGTTWCCIIHSTTTALALKTDGTLWSWGYGNTGNLGINAITMTSSPTQIPGTTWCSISQNQASHGIKTDGTMWAWGGSSSGKLGVNTNGINASSPIQIPGTNWCCAGGFEDGAFAVKSNGTAWAWGFDGGRLGLNFTGISYYSSPVQIPGTTWKKVCGANGNINGLKTDGTLWGWGNNSQGGAGINSNISASSPIQIPGTWCNFHSAMQYQAMAIRQ